MVRLGRLAAVMAWRARVRVLLLAVLVGLGMSVFCIVTELSRQSTAGLEQAIEADIGGVSGTYRYEVAANLGLAPSEVADAVVEAAKPVSTRPVTVVQRIADQRSECPPFEQLGDQPFLVIRDATLAPTPIPFGEGLPSDTKFCIAGGTLPANAVYLPKPAEQKKWGVGLVVRPDYAALARLNTVAPDTYAFVIVTGREDDMTDEILERIESVLGPAAQRNGIRLDDGVSIARLDGGSTVRAASQGIAIVYQIIGWSILLLAALGLLVAQSILVAQRMWFYGLLRAMGARSWQIAGLIMLEVTFVLLIGTSLALVILAALQPAAADLAQTSFQIDAQLIRISTIPQLALGSVVVLCLAGIYPARKAIRQDPVDVLEPALS